MDKQAAEAYTLKRSRRRTMALEVTREGGVLVRAPMRAAKRDIEDFVARHRAWIEKHREAALRRAANHPEPSAEELLRLAEMARACLPGRVEHFARAMGIRYGNIRIGSARTRYGSCKGRDLTFSCRLMDSPPEAVDYVVVHELAHIPYPNHGKEFYALVAKYMPDYIERRGWIRW